ncbi:MAG: aminotransferase class I/II-fold pyridoxal phosphate-dependent enzyme, partial [Chlorobiales bacterium]|nr:aminotransferase class I/II-fold pyridoxal phosphate-dependent enzyme [Chlorobiales bacterium]
MFETEFVTRAKQLVAEQGRTLEAQYKKASADKSSDLKNQLEANRATQNGLRDLTMNLIAPERGSMRQQILEAGALQAVRSEQIKLEKAQRNLDQAMAKVNEADGFKQLQKAAKAYEKAQSALEIRKLQVETTPAKFSLTEVMSTVANAVQHPVETAKTVVQSLRFKLGIFDPVAVRNLIVIEKAKVLNEANAKDIAVNMGRLYDIKAAEKMKLEAQTPEQHQTAKAAYEKALANASELFGDKFTEKINSEGFEAALKMADVTEVFFEEKSWQKANKDENGKPTPSFAEIYAKFCKSSPEAQRAYFENNVELRSKIDEALNTKATAEYKQDVIEAYADFAPYSLVTESTKYENLLVLRTFSKAFGLAGLRVGFGVGNSEIASWLRSAQSPFSVNIMAQEATRLVLENQRIYDAFVKQVIEERKYLKAELEMVNGVRAVDSDANFILFRVIGKDF